MYLNCLWKKLKSSSWSDGNTWTMTACTSELWLSCIWACVTKFHQLDRHLLLMVLKSGMCKIKTLADWVSGGTSSLLHGRRDGWTSWAFLVRGTNPIHEALLSWPNHLQRPHLLILPPMHEDSNIWLHIRPQDSFSLRILWPDEDVNAMEL